MGFRIEVFKVVRNIPKGKVLTYKEVATLAGNPKAYRAVGNILHTNPDMHSIPCHRVVKSNYALSEGYAFGGLAVQKEKLAQEGITFKKNKIILKDKVYKE